MKKIIEKEAEVLFAPTIESVRKIFNLGKKVPIKSCGNDKCVVNFVCETKKEMFKMIEELLQEEHFLVAEARMNVSSLKLDILFEQKIKTKG